jgi:drug/metabolite transporter (DMT)-like permease
MIPITILLDIGNIIFFLANLPQVITAFRNRKNLSGLSSNFLLCLFLGTIFFAIGNFYVDAIIASALCIVSLFFYAIQLFWKHKYRKKDEEWSPERIAEMEIERSQGK